MKDDLNKLLEEYGCKNPDLIKETVISDCSLSILQVRDTLLLHGEILHEDLNKQVYVATIRAGIKDMNSALIALKLHENKLFVAGYAKEGVIKQNMVDQAFQKLEDAVHGKNVIKPVKHKPKWFNVPIIILIVMVPIILISRNSNTIDKEILTEKDEITEESLLQEPTISPEEEALNAEIELVTAATVEYNKAVEEFNKYVESYNEAVKFTCIDNIEGFPKSLESLSEVNVNRDDIILVVKSENSEEKIIADTETILDMTEQVKDAITIVTQITNPDEDWVLERLGAIKEISGTQAVTPHQNPDGLLGKEGGYMACIYFTTPAAIPGEVPGETIVEKGTDAGGAVEVYSTLEDAEARVEYLAGFDGSVLYSGSYAIVGTMVVRTSYRLSDENQLYITNLITTEFTKLEEG